MTADLITIFNSVKSTPPITNPIGGIKISFTKESIILPKAPPITTPTAKSTTFPLETKSRNSDVNDIMVFLCLFD